MDMTSKAEKLHAEIFGAIRELCSPEYKAGCLAALRFQLGEADAVKCPHMPGTAYADAWYAGTDEGHRRGRQAREAEA